ncbi:MAG TPA: (4Fe-4S)-binding protein [Desulfosporosinus sp.]|nr:(4Fe-4S)-binding protein [Desulfosporosinus sp.]
MLFTKGSHVQVETNRCLNQQHNGVECSHCVSHCPGQALILYSHQIFLDKEKCLSCGLCFSDCPTQVFGSQQWDETTISTEVKDQGARETQFFCGYHETPFLSKEEKEKGAVQIPTCLSSISKGTWYELGLQTAVELRLDECYECPMKNCVDRMKLSVETAMEWLSASGHTPDFSCIYTAEKAKMKKKFQAVSTGLKITSRRDLFLSLVGRRKEAELPTKTERETFTCSDEMKKKKRGNNLPDWQKRLEESYSNHFREGGSPAFWPTLQMSTGCVNCGMCSKYCPTQALRITVKDKQSTHLFTSGYCLDCRICMLSCPTQSIIRDRQPISNPFEVKNIYKAPVAKCKRCESYTIVNDQNLCFWCEKEPADVDLLSDVRRRLFEQKV